MLLVAHIMARANGEVHIFFLLLILLLPFELLQISCQLTAPEMPAYEKGYTIYVKALVYSFRLCFLMLLMSEGVGFAWRLQVGHFSGSEQQSGQHFGLFVNNFLFVIANAAKCEQRRKKICFVWKFGQIAAGKTVVRLLFPSAVIYFSVFCLLLLGALGYD